MSPPATPKRIVVLGTGTAVGKTWLACELLRALGRQGQSALGLKPIESGVGSGGPSDAELLERARPSVPALEPAEPFGALTGVRVRADRDLERGTSEKPDPYRFVAPVSPHLAARRAGITIQLDKALRYVQHEESSAAPPGVEVSLIETAGGLFSPLASGLTNWELAEALAPAKWLLVAPDALGVLHEVTATLLAARARGRVPDAIALCRSRSVDASTGTNADEIAELRIAARPYVFPDDGGAGLERLLAELLG